MLLRPSLRSASISSSTCVAVWVRPVALISCATKDCTPKLTRLIPSERQAAALSRVTVPGAASIVASFQGTPGRRPKILPNSSGSSRLGVPPPKYTVSGGSGHGSSAISASKAARYRSFRYAGNTPEEKLQYVHFCWQKGKEMYTPIPLFLLTSASGASITGAPPPGQGTADPVPDSLPTCPGLWIPRSPP